jgi:hypothetical protein
MSQTTEKQSEQAQQSAVERAEELISRMEQRIGALPALVGQRTQQAVTRVSEQVKQPGANQQGAQTQQCAQAAQPNQPTMERAASVVDDMGQRMGLIAAVVSLQTRKITARVREDAEDMWAEVQQIRNGRGTKQQ